MKKESGQALIIILLIMSVGLTIGLSVISRSTSDIRITQQEEEAARAFSVAEAGIEEALLAGSGVSDVMSGVTYTVESVNQGEANWFDFGGEDFSAGETQTLWLIGHDDDGSLDPSAEDCFWCNGRLNFCWGNDADDLAALETTLLFLDTDNEFKLARKVFDADTTRAAINNFTPAANPLHEFCSEADLLSKALSDDGLRLTDGELFGIPNESDVIPYALRLKLLYNGQPQPIAVTTNTGNFPNQGTCYVSTAKVTASGVTRKVSQCQFHESPPVVFDYALFSGSNLVK